MVDTEELIDSPNYPSIIQRKFDSISRILIAHLHINQISYIRQTTCSTLLRATSHPDKLKGLRVMEVAAHLIHACPLQAVLGPLLFNTLFVI